jgi:chemotaxis protein CheD
MFIDTGLPVLFKAAYKLGLDKHRAKITVAGGAQILDKGGFFNIGERNYTMLRKILDQHGLTIDAEQVGGLVSRTITLNIATGEVRLKSSGENTETTLFKP